MLGPLPAPVGRALRALLHEPTREGPHSLLTISAPSTIVWCSGEFGRKPKLDWDPPWNGGRNHWGSCFSVLVAGGGFKGGRIVGASDAKGERVAQRPVYPPDLLGSICELLGIDPDGPLPNSR